MEKKKLNLFDIAKAAPSPTSDDAVDNALEAVQTYLNLINNDEEKISDFKEIVDTLCWEAKKSK
ncbi:MAG: hypothetical protein NT127_06615 [Sphingobacteriales bacterium]|nr:hypothetical protein [Sphingobacteriales bacterium]